MLTAAAGLISAITGLIVAIQQLRPSHPATAGARAATRAETTPSAVTNQLGSKAAPTAGALRLRVEFPSGRHVELNGLNYDVLSASAKAGNPGQIALALRVRMTNTGRYPANFWNQTFRLRVGTDTSAPTSSLDDVVQGGTTDTAEVDFTAPAATRRATLLVGDDPAHSISLPLSLNGGRK